MEDYLLARKSNALDDPNQETVDHEDFLLTHDIVLEGFSSFQGLSRRLDHLIAGESSWHEDHLDVFSEVSDCYIHLGILGLGKE